MLNIDNIPADQLTVNETATETPQDEGSSINSPHNLAMEAAFINHNFSQQVLKMVSKRFLNCVLLLSTLLLYM